MFGLFSSSKVKLIADKLISKVEMCRAQYGRATKDTIETLLRDDVGPRGNFAFSGDAPSIVFDGLPSFQFEMSAIYGGRTERDLFIHGRGEYAGFLMIADGPKPKWHCSAGGDSILPTTRAAKQLVTELSDKHGICRAPRLYGS